jgi:hypothetical protein
VGSTPAERTIFQKSIFYKDFLRLHPDTIADRNWHSKAGTSESLVCADSGRAKIHPEAEDCKHAQYLWKAILESRQHHFYAV